MRRRFALAVTVLAIVAACGRPAGDAPSPAPSASPSPSTSPADPSLLRPDPSAEPPASVVIAGPDGVFVIDTSGDVRQIVDEPAAVAVDDGAGGVVYQAARGRWYGTGNPPSTALRWRRAASSEAVTVADPEPGAALTLHDVLGGTVFATRSSGSGPEDMLDTLIAIDLVSGGERDIRNVGGWEYGSDPITVTSELIGASYVAEGSYGVDFFDHAGRTVEVPGNPIPEPNHEAGLALAELSPDAATLAYQESGPDAQGYITIPEVVFVETRTGEELRRLRLDRPDQGWGTVSFDLGERVLVVNRTVTGEYDALMDAPWVIDLSGPKPIVWEAPVAGRAQLLRSPIAL